jgi:hypothetical protein
MTLINLEQKKMSQSSIVPTIQTLTKTPTGHQYCNMSDVGEVESFLHNDGLRVNSKITFMRQIIRSMMTTQHKFRIKGSFCLLLRGLIIDSRPVGDCDIAFYHPMAMNTALNFGAL